MKNLILVSIVLLGIILPSCGKIEGAIAGGGGGDKKPESEFPNQCPQGEIYATNGMRDLIAVGNDKLFQMDRNGSTATGHIECTSNQHFTLTIESEWGNCTVANGCAPTPQQEYHDVLDVGTYQCQYSIANYIVTIFCATPATHGNVLNPGMSYFLPSYYK